MAVCSLGICTVVWIGACMFFQRCTAVTQSQAVRSLAINTLFAEESVEWV